jgi:peptide deformylase
VLRQKASPIPKIDDTIRKLLDNLVDTLRAAKGLGLAAPQIGVSKRAIVVDCGEGLWELINPEIVSKRGKDVGIEGCLSIPGVSGEVRRAARVVVEGYDREGRRIQICASGMGSRALQHEIDHLDGILFIDKANKVSDDDS